MNKNVQPVNNKDHENDWEMLFAGIFKKHEHRLYTLVLKLTRSDLYAKDVIQEVFLKLWEQRSSLHSINNLEAWLYRLTENKVIDFMRKMAADGRLKEAVWNHLSANSNETESAVTVKEYNAIIQKAIDLLPPQRRLIYYLNREGGLNYREIADELQLSRHTVKNQLSTALQSVRSFFAKSVKLLLFLF